MKIFVPKENQTENAKKPDGSQHCLLYHLLASRDYCSSSSQGRGGQPQLSVIRETEVEMVMVS